MNTPVDLLLVTATKAESQAVLNAFQRHTTQPPRLVPGDGKTYHDLGVVNDARVWLVLTEMGANGPGGAQQTVSKALAEIQPVAVVMIGIAFGMDPEKQQIGDILVSQNLRPYEPQRVGQENVLRGDRPHGSSWLLDACRNTDLHWPGAKVHFGCVLTGDKLVDNLDFRRQLRAFEPEAIGGEMEAAGLYVACQEAKVDWLLVKAICNWADGHKDQDEQQHQALAARNAAEFVLHMLQKVGLNPSASLARDRRDDQLLQSFTAALRAMAEDCSKLVTRGIALGGDPHQKPLRLAHVYVNLATKTSGNALDVLFDPQTTRVVLVGEPGSGKSTFLQYVTLCLADPLCVKQDLASHLEGGARQNSAAKPPS